MKKRLLSIVLSLCMVLALMPQMVFADTISGTTEDGCFSYTISDGEATITNYNGSVDDVEIPSSIQHEDVDYRVTAIGEGCFSYRDFKSVKIPASVKSIGIYAFNCTNLTNVTFEENSQLTSIGNFAFMECYSLTSINIPAGVTSIGNSAFEKCYSLTSIDIPSSVTSIGHQAFLQCNSLTSISIPAEVTSIGYSAFAGCRALTSIFLPDDLNASSANIPATTTKVRYSLDTERGEVTITEIALGTGKKDVAIPATICGYPVVAISDDSLLNMISSHTCAGGMATCQTKAICGICKQEYGEKNPDNHSGSMVCDTNETQHKKYWNCCDAVVTDYEDHTWNNGVCSVCDYVCEHSGGEANCTDKAECEYCGEEYGELDSSNHDLENIPAKDATVTETGNIEYWQCENCKGCFSDKDGKNSIDIADTVTKKLPPEIIEGMDQSVIAGEKKALSFTSNAAFDDFKSVTLDGDTLDTEYYTAESGSIIVTLDADYVATLPAGEHTIGIVSESGTAETTFTVEEKTVPGTTDDSDNDNSADNDKDSESDEDSVKTGDDANLALWLALMLLSGAGITGTTLYTRRKRINE